MLVYILNYISIPIHHALVRNKKQFAILVSMQLFLLLALRAPDLGVDLGNYSAGFEFISSLGLGDLLSRLRLISTANLVYPFDYESGYVVLNWLVSFLGGNFQIFLMVNAAICTAAFGTFIYKHSECPWLSFCILLSFEYYIYAFGILRQTLAIAFLLFALSYIEDNKTGKALLLIFIAFTMHRAALLYVVMFYFARHRVSKGKYQKIIAVFFTLFFVGPFIIPPAIKLVFKVVGRSDYIENVTGATLNNYIILLLLIAVGIYFLGDFNGTRWSKKTNMMLGGFLLAIPIGIMGMYSENFGRLGQMFSIMIVPLIPNVIQHQQDRVIRVLGKAIVFVLMLGFMVYTLRGDAWLVPYRFCF